MYDNKYKLFKYIKNVLHHANCSRNTFKFTCPFVVYPKFISIIKKMPHLFVVSI